VAELSGRLQTPMSRIQEELKGAAALSRRGAMAAELMPPMLGADGPRTYALVTQNNAEIRSTGGIPGAVAIIRANKGALTIVQQGTEALFGFWPKPVVPLSAEERALYGDGLGSYPQDVNFTPDFPRSAEILGAMWKKKQGQTLDGILSVDPVAISYILDATGPVAYPGTKLMMDPNGLVAALENSIYIVKPRDYNGQDDVFKKTGKAVFNVLVAGRGEPGKVLDNLTAATNEGRAFIWSSHPEEQKLIGETTIGGAMPTKATRSPQLGFYLNDAASDKMSFYLDYKADVTPQRCNANGSQLLEVKLTMKSTAPSNIKTFAYTLVAPDHPRDLYGVIRTTVDLYAPFEGRVLDSELDGDPVPMGDFRHFGRRVSSFTLDVKPGETRTVRFTVITGAHQTGEVDLHTSPSALGTGMGRVAHSACN
jgi:hypothetical protein